MRDLVRLPCIGRLADLGVPLSRIGEADGNIAPDALSQVDTEPAADMERLPRTRSDIAAILRDSAPADTPAGFEPVASGLSGPDRSMVQIYPRLHDEDTMADLRRTVEADRDPFGHDIDVTRPLPWPAEHGRCSRRATPGRTSRT
ncbi:hypothetical protein ACQEVC_24525 [Plantactinospora sp. CA-294935]|uniref:hypothetical protein n=1 Tax=Plantactinospora sp. CA-294935 TaxID=3240012 RepID=UPI003D8ED62C